MPSLLATSGTEVPAASSASAWRSLRTISAPGCVSSSTSRVLLVPIWGGRTLIVTGSVFGEQVSPEHGCASVQTKFARNLGHEVVAVPELLNPAHAHVNGKKTKSIARKLARNSIRVR